MPPENAVIPSSLKHGLSPPLPRPTYPLSFFHVYITVIALSERRIVNFFKRGAITMIIITHYQEH
jgi:hypothetical protein